jgi:hypothetical protein
MFAMTDSEFQSYEETLDMRAVSRPNASGGVKSYLAAVLIMTLLLSVWAGLCSA